MPTFKDKLKPLHACNEAIEWVGDRTAEQAWAECPRGDWMLWLAGRCEVDRKAIVLCACEIARTVLHLVPVGEDRPRRAIETAEAWARGEATLTQVRAAYAAAAAADAANVAAANVAYAAANVAYAAAAAADAAADAAAAAARAASLAQSADIVRKHFPTCPLT